MGDGEKVLILFLRNSCIKLHQPNCQHRGFVFLAGRPSLASAVGFGVRPMLRLMNCCPVDVC